MLIPFADLHITGSVERQMIIDEYDACDGSLEQQLFVDWVVEHRASLRATYLSLKQKHL